MSKLSVDYALTSILEWALTGAPDKPPSALRALAIAHLVQTGGYGRVIETGTMHGDTAITIAETGARIDTIELSPDLHRRAQERLARYGNVVAHLGDSAQVLPRLLADLDEPAVFWLDAHWCGGETARGTRETPIVQELLAILNHPIRTHAILVDDAWIFGTGDYPPLGFVLDLLRHALPEAVVEVRFGVVHAIPKALTERPFQVPRSVLSGQRE